MKTAQVSSLRPLYNSEEEARRASALAAAKFIEGWKASGGATPFAMLCEGGSHLVDEATALLQVMACGLHAIDEAKDETVLHTLRPSIKAYALDGICSLLEMAQLFREIDYQQRSAARDVTA
jgi:hypothetical protein